jgi:toxin-antitoxin system PIN domain toxin
LIAVDTNLLVYAHREEAPWHGSASRCVAQLAEGRAAWAIPWPCLHEFLAIVTHPRIFDPPSALETANSCVDAWLESPSLVLLSEAAEYWARLEDLLRSAKVTGPRVHDARIAALCLQHGVRELWSADRDFQRFPQLKVVNPLIG